MNWCVTNMYPIVETPPDKYIINEKLLYINWGCLRNREPLFSTLQIVMFVNYYIRKHTYCFLGAKSPLEIPIVSREPPPVIK